MFGVTYRCNPVTQIPSWAQQVIQLWNRCRGEFGLMHLPDRGGMNDQAAWLMDAFGVCGAAEAELRKEEKPDAPDR